MVIVILPLKFHKIFSSKGTLIFVLKLILYKHLWKQVLNIEKIFRRRRYQSAKKNFFSTAYLKYLELIFLNFFYVS
jgi:hypothetical protein